MKKKVMFVLSSFSAGGAERVFWLISQAFDKSKFDVIVVILNSRSNALSFNLSSLTVIDLKTIKASASFIPLYRLLRKEAPYAVFSTGGQINLLVSIISIFLKIPNLIARGTNIPDEIRAYSNFNSKFLSYFGSWFFRNFDYVICQSKEMYQSWKGKGAINPESLIIIPNPVMIPDFIRESDHNESIKRLIIVARLSSVKGHDRLLDIVAELPREYRLTIAGGAGNAKESVKLKVEDLNLSERVNFVGETGDVCKMVSEHSLFVLSSYTEGFPNVLLEALSVGVPVITYRVGGVSEFVIDDFNGYIVEQGDLEGYKNAIIKACNRQWNHREIADNIRSKYSLEKIVKCYEDLVSN